MEVYGVVGWLVVLVVLVVSCDVELVVCMVVDLAVDEVELEVEVDEVDEVVVAGTLVVEDAVRV